MVESIALVDTIGDPWETAKATRLTVGSMHATMHTATVGGGRTVSQRPADWRAPAGGALFAAAERRCVGNVLRRDHGVEPPLGMLAWLAAARRSEPARTGGSEGVDGVGSPGSVALGRTEFLDARQASKISPRRK
jgi:hypothetical protein